VSERLLTAAELGELLGLSQATILDRFQRGDLPGYRLWGRKGGPVRFRLSEVERALDGWRVGEGVVTRSLSTTRNDARETLYDDPVNDPGNTNEED
jgi:excisionase family DNA binding protein